MNEPERTELIVIDCEMSGLNPFRHELLSFGHVRAALPHLVLQREGDSKIRPVHLNTAQREALRMTGYSAEEWHDAIGLFEAMNDLREAATNCMPVGWAFDNDLAFLSKAMQYMKLPLFLQRNYLELQYWAEDRFKFGSIPALQTIARHLGIFTGKPHVAPDDARTTFEILRAFWFFSPEELRERVATEGWTLYSELPENTFRVMTNQQVADRLVEMSRYIRTYRYDNQFELYVEPYERENASDLVELVESQEPELVTA